jgi:glycosyltransferase involved in cell wall biosynthesis
MSLSIVVLAKNEEKNIKKCLEACLFADEVLVIDDFSQDGTSNIVESFKNKKIRFVQRKLDRDFASQRNFGLNEVAGEWVLFIDADELVSKELAEEIKRVTNSQTLASGFFIKREDILWGKKIAHGELLNFKTLRLGKRNTGTWRGKVHEEWKMQGRVDVLHNILVHEPHASVKEFIREINFYTTIRAEELYREGVTTNALLIILYPKAKFILNYFIKMGFLDGVEGLLLSILMSFHSFLVRGKLYLLQKNKK